MYAILPSFISRIDEIGVDALTIVLIALYLTKFIIIKNNKLVIENRELKKQKKILIKIIIKH